MSIVSPSMSPTISTSVPSARRMGVTLILSSLIESPGWRDLAISLETMSSSRERFKPATGAARSTSRVT